MTRIQPRETRDISARGFGVLVGSYVGLVIVGVLVSLGVQKWLLGRFFRGDRALTPVVNVLPPEPRLEPDNSANLEKLHAEEDQLLSRYAWVDRKAGIARIPLERALDVALREGFPSVRRKR